MPHPLSLEALRKRCDPKDLPFDSTAELEDLAEALGQERARRSRRLKGNVMAVCRCVRMARRIGLHQLPDVAVNWELPREPCYA